jgi:hypothetical protein
MRFSRKLSAVLVLAIHAVTIAALLRATFQSDTPPEQRQTEMQIILEQLPQKTVAKAPGQSDRATGPGSLPLPDFVNPNPSPQALSLGLALFGCKPENLRDLTTEQQAKCAKWSGNAYTAVSSGLPVYIKPPGPEWEGLRNSDLRARERNTSDPCMAAKLTGTECVHEILYGKGLW